MTDSKPIISSQPMMLDTLWAEVTSAFQKDGMDNARQEAKWLLKALLNLSETDFLSAAERQIIKEDIDSVRAAAAQRRGGWPLSKIVGKKGFWTHEFHTSEAVLDPRPDTEVLIEEALAFAASCDLTDKPIRILDLGTGSGCIMLTLLSELPNARGVAVDISADALDIARQNADHLGMSGRVTFRRGSWLEALEGGDIEDGFDIVVSNPPYIPSADIESLMVEVKDYDPILALDGGAEGMDAYEIILRDVRAMIHPHGRLFVEIGTNQTEQILRLVQKYGFASVNIKKDLGGINRVVSMALGET